MTPDLRPDARFATGAAFGGARRSSGSSGTIVAFVIFVAFAAGAVYRYWPSEERSIRRHLSNMAEALSLSTSESEAERLTRLAALHEYFAPDVQLRAGDREIVSSERLLDEIARWTPPPGGIAVEFVDVQVALADSGSAADVTLTARISTPTRPGAVAALDTRTARVGMRKLAGDWVIATVDATAAR